eukprot:TRINITY_DN13741_c0_g1_i1.p1 TRINITY_DN13741_c0_g1~~TRINITY_DN13741_c0_g1_i1.p1  ORF type:complete len:244 (-),score=63.13 TRINITY_DN13741_c0_g1_i1:78-809(-)
MEAVLNFMYHGEVNVAQDDLNSFLQVAEDLRVKGLTQNNSSSTIDSSKIHPPVPKAEPRIEPYRPSTQDPTTATAKRPRPTPTVTSTIPQQLSQPDDDIAPVVKSEPRDPTPTMISAPVVQQQSMAMYNEGSQQMGDSMMMTMDTEQYDDSYGGEYEGHYEDQTFDTSMVPAGQDTSGAGNKERCEICGKDVHPRALKRHMQTVHNQEACARFTCSICHSVFKSNLYLKDHLRKLHNVYQTKA